jgi:hypothetical protein
VSDTYANAVWWAMQIAGDVETCAALLAGEPVDPARLRPEWLEYAAEFRLVRLDVCAIDLLHRRAELHRLRELLRDTAA